jgi:hypothetical protein
LKLNWIPEIKEIKLFINVTTMTSKSRAVIGTKMTFLRIKNQDLLGLKIVKRALICECVLMEWGS